MGAVTERYPMGARVEQQDWHQSIDALHHQIIKMDVLANHFYFGMEINLQHFLLCNVNRFIMFFIAFVLSFLY